MLSSTLVGEHDASPERLARRAARREALERLATAVRGLIDASVTTDVEPARIDEAQAVIRAVTERLNERRHPGTFSGLLGRGAIDPAQPNRAVPLSPWAGFFNPLAPPIRLESRGDTIVGHVRLGKPYIGPPGSAHGGVVAGIMDQLVASAGQSIGVAGVTATLSVRFRQPTPLETDLTLRAWADPREDDAGRRTIRAEIRAGEVVTAEAHALVVRTARFQRPG